MRTGSHTWSDTVAVSGYRADIASIMGSMAGIGSGSVSVVCNDSDSG